MNRYEFGEKFALSFLTGLISGGVVAWFAGKFTISIFALIVISIIGIIAIYQVKK